MGTWNYIVGIYKKVDGAARYEAGDRTKGIQNIAEGHQRTSSVISNLCEKHPYIECIPGVDETIRYVDDKISEKAYDVGVFCGEKYRKVKDFLS